MKIRLDIFEGPLDLLLYLIKKNHVDVYDIPISNVVEQYLEFLELMQILDINVASEYMVMAATLINIKSKMLLPQEKAEEVQEEDPRDELVRKLLEYEKFKEAAGYLKEKEKERLKYVSRPKSEQRENLILKHLFSTLSVLLKRRLKKFLKRSFWKSLKMNSRLKRKCMTSCIYYLNKERFHLRNCLPVPVVN